MPISIFLLDYRASASAKQRNNATKHTQLFKTKTAKRFEFVCGGREGLKSETDYTFIWSVKQPATFIWSVKQPVTFICKVVLSNAHAKYLRNSIGRDEQVLNIHSSFFYIHRRFMYGKKYCTKTRSL